MKKPSKISKKRQKYLKTLNKTVKNIEKASRLSKNR